MADARIQDLATINRISGGDHFVLEHNGESYNLQGQTLLNWLTAAADGHGGIQRVEKTGTVENVDTYTIFYADKTTSTFTVTNGLSGVHYGSDEPAPTQDVWIDPDGTETDLQPYVKNTLEAHPEWSTTVQDGSLGPEKLKLDFSKAVTRSYGSITDVAADTTLKIGMTVMTAGFYAENDGGGCAYKVCEQTPEGAAVQLPNGMYAVPLVGDSISANQMGAKPFDSSVDNAKIINACLGSFPVVTIGNGTYTVKSTIKIPRNRTLTGLNTGWDGEASPSGATTLSADSMTGFMLETDEGAVNRSVTIGNICFKANDICDGLKIPNLYDNSVIKNVAVINPVSVGITTESGSDKKISQTVIFQNVWVLGTACKGIFFSHVYESTFLNVKSLCDTPVLLDDCQNGFFSHLSVAGEVNGLILKDSWHNELHVLSEGCKTPVRIEGTFYDITGDWAALKGTVTQGDSIATVLSASAGTAKISVTSGSFTEGPFSGGNITRVTPRISCSDNTVYLSGKYPAIINPDISSKNGKNKIYLSKNAGLSQSYSISASEGSLDVTSEEPVNESGDVHCTSQPEKIEAPAPTVQLPPANKHKHFILNATKKVLRLNGFNGSSVTIWGADTVEVYVENGTYRIKTDGTIVDADTFTILRHPGGVREVTQSVTVAGWQKGNTLVNKGMKKTITIDCNFSNSIFTLVGEYTVALKDGAFSGGGASKEMTGVNSITIFNGKAYVGGSV